MEFFTRRHNAVGVVGKVRTNVFCMTGKKEAKTRREGRDEEHGLDHSERMIRMIRLISLGIMREAQETEREKGGKCSARALHYVTVTLHRSVVVA